MLKSRIKKKRKQRKVVFKKSRITPEAIKELHRRKINGDDMTGAFNLKTGKPLPLNLDDNSVTMKELEAVGKGGMK